MDFHDLPDGWEERGFETGPQRGDGPYTEEFEATWVDEDDEMVIHAHHSVDSRGEVTYPIFAEQHIGNDEYETVVQTHNRLAEDRTECEEAVVEFMKESNAGKHRLRTMGVEVPEENDFVQFYCISDSELPEGMDGEQLIDVLDTDTDSEIDDLPDHVTRELASDEMVQIDVYPRAKAHFED